MLKVANKENLRPLTVEWRLMARNQASCMRFLKVDPVKNRSVVQLTIHEGRNHQTGKMFEAVGLRGQVVAYTFGNLRP